MLEMLDSMKSETSSSYITQSFLIYFYDRYNVTHQKIRVTNSRLSNLNIEDFLMILQLDISIISK